MTYTGLRYDKTNWRGAVSNGQIDRTRLREVEAWPLFDRDLGQHPLAHPEAAAAMGVFLRQAHEDGHPSLVVSLSYRTLAKQQEKWEDFQNGGNLAATPGTSNHGWAVAFDMRWGNDAALRYLQLNAGRYGFINDVPSENWHYTLQEGLWRGDDMTEAEKAEIQAATRRAEGDRDYREKFKDAGNDPGPPLEAKPAAYKDGWNSARFPVRILAAHIKQPHGEGGATDTSGLSTKLHTHREGTTGPAVEP